ncbi:hypothetical protein AAFF_G00399520 [Aldrovandia affinis]|uniref:Uncharacterized protein n=1 Tax=Aldrovandia affinis TaxID=143900 RepID=A0AAD7WKK0_9TELE|nr:hypothetical protein AAFF_G00399520 [Aldrovandia affinis]
MRQRGEFGRGTLRKPVTLPVARPQSMVCARATAALHGEVTGARGSSLEKDGRSKRRSSNVSGTKALVAFPPPRRTPNEDGGSACAVVWRVPSLRVNVSQAETPALLPCSSRPLRFLAAGAPIPRQGFSNEAQSHTEKGGQSTNNNKGKPLIFARQRGGGGAWPCARAQGRPLYANEEATSYKQQARSRLTLKTQAPEKWHSYAAGRPSARCRKLAFEA